MTEHSDTDGPDGPPALTDDLVADLHAGVLDDAAAARLWPLVHADRGASAVLAALDATTADLRGLGAGADTGSAPTPTVRMPGDVAARLDAALAALGPRSTTGPGPRLDGPPVTGPQLVGTRPAGPQRPDPPAPQLRAPAPAGPPAPTDLAAARARRAGRSRRWAPAVGVAAAAVLVVGIGVGTLGRSSGGVAGTPQAAPLPSGVTDLGSSVSGPQAVAALGATSYGPLDDAATRAACLAANGVPAGTAVLGASEVVLDGQRGVLLLLPGPVPPRLTALVVGSACGPGTPDTLARQDIGGR